jgi:2-polyprenyl-3-methyl-5-hydroxy-6-metoxy-1,4-benzoquinol methylase
MVTLDLEKLKETNAIYRSLLAGKLVSPENIEVIHHRTRDMELPVLRDRKSRVIFLKEALEQRFYNQAGDGGDLDGDKHLSHTFDGGVVRSKKLEDEGRRLEQFLPFIKGKSICDFGTGHGLFLDLCVGVASQVSGVELRQGCINDIHRRLGDGVSVQSSFKDFEQPFDSVTMFHVLEHLEDQQAHLDSAYKALKSGGEIILEVPHAEDFLIEKMALEAFYDFGFWSEHLILHTRGTIRHFLQAAGFADIKIFPFQRFGYANHLHWLRHGKPGGHDIYKDIPSDEFDQSYREFLCQRNWSDTLIATARRP